MLIATLGHINERACARWLDHSPGDPERDRMATLFGETVADPLDQIGDRRPAGRNGLSREELPLGSRTANWAIQGWNGTNSSSGPC